MPPRILLLGYNAFDVNIPVDGLPLSDTKTKVDAIRLGGGGPGATAAVALARLGAQVRLVTPLTDDLPGRLQEAELHAAGVDLTCCPRMPGHQCAKAVILVDSRRQHRTIFWCRGDLPLIAPRQLPADLLEGMDLFYHDGHEPLAGVELAARAVASGIPVVMDAGSVREGSRELAAGSTDVISSEGFAPGLTGCGEPVAALQALADLGPRRVAMTFGAGGVLALDGNRPLALPAFDLPVVDTTGAGDAFHAGYAFGRATGLDFVQCLRLGAATAALKCRDWGGRAGLPQLAEVQAVLRQAPVKPLDPRIAGFPTR